MPLFQELDPEIILRLVEGYQDEISPAAKADNIFYGQFRCPRCDCTLDKEFDPRTAFTGSSFMPKALLRCPNCRFLLDPHTNVVVEFGNAAKIPVTAIPILGGK